MTKALSLVAIYADESCLGNGREGSNPGGAAGVIEYQPAAGGRLVRFDYWISEPATTNNRMALRSAIEALRIVSRKGERFRVLFTSDSQYLVTGMKEWVYGWIGRGWRRKSGALENADLWRQAVALAQPHETEWQWVRGHAGHPQNEYAHYLAMRAARDQTSSDGPVPSGFDAWLAERRATGRLSAEPAVFPDARLFRPSRPLPAQTSQPDRPHGPNKGRRT
ncbi:MAG: ribonuclease HI [Gemmatimonadota bacterium]|nr:ribonuclease HI [Gemmatimonadota bacterium]